MDLTWQNLEEINRQRARIAEVSGVETYPHPLLEINPASSGSVTVWFAAKDNSFVTLQDGEESVYAVESFEPDHWSPEPHNV